MDVWKQLAGLVGFKGRPPTPDNTLPPLPPGDDVNSNGFTQFFSISARSPPRGGTESTTGLTNQSQEELEPYRDVNLRVHVRLLKQQERVKVRLHVKVDPEDTDHWIIPEKGKTNDLFFYADDPIIPLNLDVERNRNTSGSGTDPKSAGYHSQSDSEVEGDCVEDERIPVIMEDHEFVQFMRELGQIKRDYETTKLEIGEFVYTFVFNGEVSSDRIKGCAFEEICRFLRDYFIACNVEINNLGDLVFFEIPNSKKVKKKKKSKKKKLKKGKAGDSVDSLSQLTIPRAPPDLAYAKREKKNVQIGVALYTELQHIYLSYRETYFEAVDEYEVQMLESRFGYHMCEMQEEITLGNLVLVGTVQPTSGDSLT